MIDECYLYKQFYKKPTENKLTKITLSKAIRVTRIPTLPGGKVRYYY